MGKGICRKTGAVTVFGFHRTAVSTRHLIETSLLHFLFTIFDADACVFDLSSKLSHQPVLLFLRDPYVLPAANGNQTCHLLTAVYWSDPAAQNCRVITNVKCFLSHLIIYSCCRGQNVARLQLDLCYLMQCVTFIYTFEVLYRCVIYIIWRPYTQIKNIKTCSIYSENSTTEVGTHYKSQHPKILS